MHSFFMISWSSGNDPHPSSGIVAYDVYMWDNDLQNPHLWQEYYEEGLSAVFSGAQHGHKYYFEAVAVDAAGNREVFLNLPECSTYVDTSLGGNNYIYLPGDCNMILGFWPPEIIGSDVTYLVNYVRGINSGCNQFGLFASADVNGDCMVIGSDITRLVTYFRGAAEISWCNDYPPAWLAPIDCPEHAPPGWPDCE